REFPVDQIKVNNDNFWPLFRSMIYGQLLDGLIMIFPKSSNTIAQKLVNSSFKCWRWFSRGNYVFISNEMERKNQGEIVIDKLAEGIIMRLGYHQSLYVEQAKKRHLNGRSYGKKRVVSFDLVLVLAGLYKKIRKPGYRARIFGEDVYKDIIEAYSLKSDYQEMLDTFLSKVYILQFIFRLIKPKAIFITDYGNLSVIFAAKKLGIPVIEFQHGLIGREHPYYHPAKPLESKFRPDYILVFGTNDVEGLSHGNYVPLQNIIPIGNYYLNSLVDQPVNVEILEILKKYEFSICVPTDFTTHEYLVNFICAVAVNLPNYVFIISPRQLNLDDNHGNLPSNVKIIVDYSFQEIVRHCDFNSCTNSTCCLEAISFGARNILIDEDGLATQYFGNVLLDSNITRFAKSKENYIQHITTMAPMEKTKVRSSNSGIYAEGTKEQINEVINLIATLNRKQ
ncbi:MAG: hypothetical protein RLO12_17495, partial [Fulvivirga sp.]